MAEDKKETLVGDLIAPVAGTRRDIDTADNTVITETKTAVYNHSYYTESLRVSDGNEEIASGDFSDSAFGSSVSHHFKGDSRSREKGNIEICNILITRLNQSGSNWNRCVDVSNRGDDVDCEAYDGTKVLKIQVTRSEYDQDFWKSLKKTGSANSSNQPKENRADALRNAIDQKSRKIATQSQRKEILLVLDATETISHILKAVVDSFRERHGGWAQRLGFGQIWVVGPYPMFTYRLDVPQ